MDRVWRGVGKIPEYRGRKLRLPRKTPRAPVYPKAPWMPWGRVPGVWLEPGLAHRRWASDPCGRSLGKLLSVFGLLVSMAARWRQ